MCTAATYRSQDFYFGRTFDYEFNYGEEVVVTPRNYSFQLRHQNALTEHYAMIGIAHMVGDYPLYYDAVNEKGLGMAGLNFAGNAVYRKPTGGQRQYRTVRVHSLDPGTVCYGAGSPDAVSPHQSGGYAVQRAVSDITAALDTGGQGRGDHDRGSRGGTEHL